MTPPRPFPHAPAALLVATLAAAALSGCGRSDTAADRSAEMAPAAPAAAPAPAVTPEQAKALLAALPPPYNAGDLENGRRRFSLCRSCHSIAEGGPDLVGPNLYGVFGRTAGTKPGYSYSQAVKSAGFTWDAAHLNDWLAAPRTYLPGTKMTFAGLKSDTDRRDLIAYLKVNSGYKPEATTGTVAPAPR